MLTRSAVWSPERSEGHASCNLEFGSIRTLDICKRAGARNSVRGSHALRALEDAGWAHRTIVPLPVLEGKRA